MITALLSIGNIIMVAIGELHIGRRPFVGWPALTVAIWKSLTATNSSLCTAEASANVNEESAVYTTALKTTMSACLLRQENAITATTIPVTENVILRMVYNLVNDSFFA